MKNLPESIVNRCVKEARFMLQNSCSIRECAKAFNVSKSTVHLDVSKRLKHLNFLLYKNVKILLKNNFKTKHIKGGLKTKLKHKKT